MRIEAVETLRLDEFPNVLWVRLHTDNGLCGLGETFFGARAVEAYIHETAAPLLLGADARRVEGLGEALTPYVGYAGTGAETRGRSAIDVALWDLLGQQAGMPVYQLLGGLTRERVRTYNTCAGYRYVRSNPDWSTSDWGHQDAAEGPYEDLDAFLHRADELAGSLLEEGVTGMKIWPFDFAAEASGGYYISNEDLEQALEPLRKIRAAVGERMDIMVELHGLWRLPAAFRIARALEPFNPFWFEDPVRADSIDALAEFARRTPVPVCSNETLGGAGGFTALIQAEAAAIVMPDVVWCGGISAARRIAALAQAWHRPVAPHDCTGPVAFTAAVHLSLSLPNVLVQESVRAFYHGWYQELVTALPPLQHGYILPPEGPGLGTRLRPGLERREDATRVVSETGAGS
jgi:L-alanine-DL-glutamate epimerase-like enolase superfamily enzyme